MKQAGVVKEADWLTEGGSPGRAQAAGAVLAPPLEEMWVYNAGAGFGQASPLWLGQTIFVANRKGEVHAIDAETGRRAGMDNFGDAIEGSPLIHQGVLYIPVAWGRRALFAYNLGRAGTRWRVRHTPIEAGLLPLGDGVLAVDMEATVRVYARDEGTVLWERALGEERAVHAAPVLAAGRVIVADDQGGVVALRPEDGVVEWTHVLDAPVYASFAAADSALYLPTTRGRLYSLDAETGYVRWRFALPDTTVRFSAPAIDDKLLVAGASDGMLRAFDAATGDVRWSYDAADAVTAAPLITAEAIYVGTMGGELLALNRQDGTLQWQHTLRGRIKSPMAARDGYLVVLSEPRFVYLFKSSSASYHVATP